MGPANHNGSTGSFTERLKRIVLENMSDEGFGVNELAELSGLSRSQLFRKLKQYSDRSVSQFIQEIRLNEALRLLQEEDISVSEVAYKVGFNTPSYFTKVFKDHFKITPGATKGNPNNIIDHLQIGEDTIPLATTTRRRWYVRSAILIILIVSLVLFNWLFISTNKPSKQRSIAVLPLQNLTGNNDNAYFVDGMHDALIGELGQIGSLRVISRTSTLRYKDSKLLIKDIASELGVNTIVEGSVLNVGDSVRLIIQVIDVYPKEKHLLAKEYQNNMPQVLSVQSNMVRDIAQKINIELADTEQKKLTRQRTVNPEAYKAYLRGMYFLNQGTKESFEKGISCLYEAIDRDPADAFAYAGLALGYSIIGHGQLDSEQAFKRATSAAKKAITLDPEIDEAYIALSILYLYNTCDWPLAHEAFKGALANNPNSAIANAHYAWYHILFEDKEKTLYHAKKAVQIEPLSASYCSWLAMLSYHFEEFEEAEYWAKKSLELKDNIPYGNICLSWVYLKKNNFQKALEYCNRIPKKGAYWKMHRGYIYTQANQREKALELWNELESFSNTRRVNLCHLGFMAAYLGFDDKAFDLLNKAADNHSYPITYINFYPETENLRKDPRYNQLLEKLNLPHEKLLYTEK